MNRYRLTDICDFQGGSQPPKSQWKDTYKNGYIRMLQIRDFTQKTEKIEYVKETNSIKKCSEDDILIARYGASIGKILTGLEGAYNVAIVKTIPNSKILSKTYLYYYLNSSIFQKYIKNVGSRAAQAGFNKKELNKLEIDLPTLDKQKIIVENLQKIQNIISNKEYQIAALDNLIKSLFVEMFKNVKETIKLGDCCSVHARIGWQALTKSEHMQKGEYMLITGTDFKDNEIDYSTCVYVSKERYEMDKNITLKNNDILITKDGTIGKVAIIHNLIKPATLNSGIFVVRPKRIFNKDYITYIFKGPLFAEFINKSKTGATIKHLNQKHLVEFDIPIPSIDLQNKFAEFVNQIDKQKFEIQNSLNKMKELYETMMNKYFG